MPELGDFRLMKLQGNHAWWSTGGHLVPETNSDHFIHLDEPELVVKATQSVLEDG